MKKLKISLSLIVMLLVSGGVAWAVVSNLSGGSNITVTEVSTNNYRASFDFKGLVPGGSVMFASGSSLSYDSNFFWNNTTKRLGIGTGSPSYSIDVQGGQVNASGGLCINGVCKASWNEIASGSANYVPKFTNQTTVQKSQIYDNGTNVGIGTTSPGSKLSVNGTAEATHLTANTVVASGLTGQPASASTGQIYFNRNARTFMGYNGTEWLTLNTTPIFDNTHSADFVLASNQKLTFTPTGLPSGDASRTLEAWVKFTSLPSSGNEMTVFGYGDTGSTGELFWLGIYNNTGTYVFQNDRYGLANTGTTSLNLSTGVWYHFAVTYDGTNYRNYLNGSLTDTVTRTNGVLNTVLTSGAIGHRIDSDVMRLDGKVDDARVWNTVRTGTDIVNNKDLELIGNESGLVAYWKLNNSLSATTGGNNLTNVASVSFSSDTPF